MSVTANGTINPKTIISGDSIRCYDNSTSLSETVVSTTIYVIDPRVVTATPGTRLYLANANTLLEVDEIIIWEYNGTTIIQPTGFAIKTNYYVIEVTSTYFVLSLTKGGTAVTYSSTGTSPTIQKGCTFKYPTIKPFPVTSNQTRYVRFLTYGYSTQSYVDIPFYTLTTAQTKPTVDSTYKDISIFIYNATSATLIKRDTTSTCNLLYTKLTFTDYITKVPIAKFTIYNPGSATDIEKDLLLAGSALNKKQDNYVAIIVGDCIAWSGKILRSNQGKEGLYGSTLVQSWDIDCEGDISRMQYQQVKTANKGDQFLPIGQIITKLVENSDTVIPYTLINWNGTVDPGVRSSEGLFLNYNISDADMYSQFITLAKSIDFDWRTRLVYTRYAFTRVGSVYTVNASAYGMNSFLNRWVITSGGSFGKCSSSNSLNLTATLSPTPATSGTLLVIMDPVLDVVNDLSTPTKVNSFQINVSPSTSVCNGYGFDDKTDRSLLATKIIAKAKSKEGVTKTSAIAAVTPWNSSKCMFENTTTITRRTEGIVLAVESIQSGGDSGIYWTLEGWGYPSTGNMYWAIKKQNGIWYDPSSSNLVQSGAPPVEMYNGNQRVTKFRTLYTGAGYIDVGDLMIYTTATYPPTGPFYGYYYVNSLVDLNYVAGMDIYIGGETITTTDSYNDPVLGPRIRYMMDGNTKHRDKSSEYTSAHQPGAIMWRGGIYDEELSHTENDYSPAYYHGIISKTYVSDTNATSSELETYATLNLIKNSFYYRKGSFWCILFDWFKTDYLLGVREVKQSFIQVGDTLSCLQNILDTDSDLLYGQPKNLWQVISYTFDANTYKVIVELGDFERNVFTQLTDKTSSLHQIIT